MNALANEWFDNILQIAESQLPPRRKYALLHQVFVGVLNEHTRDSSLSFSGLYARFDYLCRKVNFPTAATRRVNAFRNRAMNATTLDDNLLATSWPYDLKAVAEFAACLYQEPVPSRLKALLPACFPKEAYQGILTDCVRVVVRDIDKQRATVTVQPVDCDAKMLTVALAKKEKTSPDFTYLIDIMRVGDRLNLIRPRLCDGVYHPELIILLPDLLINITTVAGCFKDYGNSPLHFLLSMLSPNFTSAPILLGNFAGQMLDEEVHHTQNDVTYRSSILTFFRKNAAKLAVCPDINDNFHKEARSQQSIIRDMVRNKFKEIRDYKQEEVLLEPSFFSEMLGLQGRMDLLQADMRVLIEQKSGKRNFYTNGHQENHFVQVLLYRAILHYNYAMPNDKIDSYLLYSKFEDGLIKEGAAPVLLAEAMKIRNQIAQIIVDLAEGGAERLFMSLTPQTFNLQNLNNRFWNEYIKPQLEDALKSLHDADELTRKYFFRMLTFVAEEYLLGKVGTADREASGAAAMWNATTEEKLSAGNMLHELTIKQLAESAPGEGITTIVFGVDADSLTTLPNFREGDMVVAYSYDEGNDPRPTHTMLFRANIVRMQPDEVTIALRDPQKNTRIFKKGDIKVRWALEHDFSDSSFSSHCRSVAQVLRATDDRRRLLLGLRLPRVDLGKEPLGDYGPFQPLVQKFVSALDYMLLIGPPGTGKTSFGLVNILKEQLVRETGAVILLSYTNRAVNEICSKLVEHHIDFIRIGSGSSCPEEYRKYLMGEKAGHCDTLVQVRQMFATTRVYVSTTASMLNNGELFECMPFSLAIIDEASQILDPHLMGILCARHGEKNAIQRFVLIGDQKQLPAVVQQSEALSMVNEKMLRDAGIIDCRHSLFERLLRLNANTPMGVACSADGQRKQESAESDVVYMFHKQGRMHQEVADFANQAYYGGCLGVVPLQHQLAPCSLSFDPADDLACHLATHRMAFLSVVPSGRLAGSEAFSVGGDKMNRAEAKVIARVAKTVYDLYVKNGKEFLPDNSLGIIVPYRHQIACVREHLKEYGIPQLLEVTIDTVERYQGSQRDVIVYGFTIQKRRQLDFLLGNIYDDNGTAVDRKLNVALTRAREQTVLVGNPHLLAYAPDFDRLVRFVRERGGYWDGVGFEAQP